MRGPFEYANAPHWDDTNHKLYFVDVDRTLIYGYVPSTKTLLRATVDKPDGRLAFIIPVSLYRNLFCGSLGSAMFLFTWHEVLNVVTKKIFMGNNDHFLDENESIEGKVAPSGFIFIGMYSFPCMILFYLI